MSGDMDARSSKNEETRADFDTRSLGVAYTLASGRLFCEMGDFHRFAEDLLDRPIFTHEFGDGETWVGLRQAYEARVLENLADHDYPPRRVAALSEAPNAS